MHYRILLAFALGLGLSVPSVAASCPPAELIGTVGSYAYRNPINGDIQHSTVLMLFAPITLAGTNESSSLDNIILVELLSRDDEMLQEFGLYTGKVVRVTCELETASLWGYRHASCTPTSVRAAPNNSFNPMPLRGTG